ncbi:hypothetical protein PG996_008677 [Apiospora saccharicola]|uniref:Uncharacterized protein n=1 Tax=Apiospora saccharicola TaxID=335842 RepID=A0ABR1V156_9PEZI
MGLLASSPARIAACNRTPCPSLVGGIGDGQGQLVPAVLPRHHGLQGAHPYRPPTGGGLLRQGRRHDSPQVHKIDRDGAQADGGAPLDRGVGKRRRQEPGLVVVKGLAREEQQAHVGVGLAGPQDPLGELGHGRHRRQHHRRLELDQVLLHGLEADVARDGQLDGPRAQLVDGQDVQQKTAVQVPRVEQVGHQVPRLHAAPGQALGQLLAHPGQLVVAVEGDLGVRRRACSSDDAIRLLRSEHGAVAAGVALPEGCMIDHGNVAERHVVIIEVAPGMCIIRRVGLGEPDQLPDGRVGCRSVGLGKAHGFLTGWQQVCQGWASPPLGWQEVYLLYDRCAHLIHMLDIVTAVYTW